MKWFWLLIIGWFVVSFLWEWLSKRNRRSGPPPTPQPDNQRSSPVSDREKSTFRPSSTRYRDTSGIDFKLDVSKNARDSSGRMPNAKELEGLRDAFTGESLNPSKGLYRCTKCRVYYHAASFSVLVSENSSQCVSCGSPNLVGVSSESARQQGGVNYDPTVVTLANVHLHAGRVVTFEGYAHQVHQSRRQKDYAVMFENATWTKGFKLVFFRGSVHRVGGPAFIYSLRGRSVRVRGLIIDHSRFGLEILVSERSMILSVR